MDQALLISNIVLWLVVLAMLVVILALLRQIGVLHERVAPAGALLLRGQGPKVGEAAPEMVLADLTGRAVRIGGESASEKSTLVFFLSPTCPVCDSLLPVLASIRDGECAWLEVVLASDGEPERQRAFVRRKKLEDFAYVLSTELGMRYQVGRLPYAVLIDERGIIRAKGLVNTREHLESLFEAKEQGVASLQAYLRGSTDRQNVA